MELKRTVLVPYAAESMFDLIEQAEHYPEFLPWCIGVTMLERSDDWVGARIEFKYFQVRFGFQTRNPKRRPEWLHVRLVQGPFKRFQGDWELIPLGQLGCRINFNLSYEVSDGLLDRVAAKAVDVVARSMMDAFVKRAEDTLTPISALPGPQPAAPADTPVLAPVQALPEAAIDAPPAAPAQAPAETAVPVEPEASPAGPAAPQAGSVAACAPSQEVPDATPDPALAPLPAAGPDVTPTPPL